MEVRVTGHNFENLPLKDIHAMFGLNWLTGFRREYFKTFFP
jgi:hypothetical protein